MIRAYTLPEYSQCKASAITELEDAKNIIWIDLQASDLSEIKAVEKKYNINFPTQQEHEEIETSSRYVEEDMTIKINSTFLIFNHATEKLDEQDISFILKDNILFTHRNFDSKVLAETVKRIKNQPQAFNHPSKILVSILETRIDYDADTIEAISGKINELSRTFGYHKNLDEKVIIRISSFQELMITVREALFDKQRVVSALLKNDFIQKENSEKLRIIIKDINSLIDHTSFNFTRLEYLQNSFLGLINIEQNKIIKIFTIAAVVFMPPTLIASIYGMNFEVMPELQWAMGYPFALALIVLSSLITLWIFKRKKWL